ncbi:hypothetical protein EVAR_39553_1 [Eumeta japonica]|uniref:Uncharacterized protein n=1 Tax=Eumeta variegata TaxID=151549 RepID=A0A4C1XJD9_EUMVA|nr:hypothetical protein EVAR_39553_1 [Eumeta japonica]
MTVSCVVRGLTPPKVVVSCFLLRSLNGLAPPSGRGRAGQTRPESARLIGRTDSRFERAFKQSGAVHEGDSLFVPSVKVLVLLVCVGVEQAALPPLGVLPPRSGRGLMTRSRLWAWPAVVKSSRLAAPVGGDVVQHFKDK